MGFFFSGKGTFTRFFKRYFGSQGIGQGTTGLRVTGCLDRQGFGVFGWVGLATFFGLGFRGIAWIIGGYNIFGGLIHFAYGLERGDAMFLVWSIGIVT